MYTGHSRRSVGERMEDEVAPLAGRILFFLSPGKIL